MRQVDSSLELTSSLNPTAPEFTIHELPRATPGSAGLDLASAKDMILSKWDGISLIPTFVKGQLLPQTVGLIIGRSSNYQKNFEVLPGIIDADIENDIKIMVRPLSETIQIHKGQRIAQLLLLPYIKLPNPVLKPERGAGQFGSTEAAAWVQHLDERPFKVIKLNGRKFRGLLDTGANRTCISASDWPTHWPVQKTGSSLLGLGTASGVMQSSTPLKWELEGKEGLIQPYVLPSLPFSLWGRDMMGDLNLKLVTADHLSDQHFS